MIFDIRKSSDWDYKETKEINTLYDLLAFLKECESDFSAEIILGINKGYLEYCKNEYYIEIYDSWRE